MKVGRYLLLMLIGAIVGGIIGVTFSVFENKKHLLEIDFANHEITVIVSIIASVINILLTVALYKVQKDSLKYKFKMNQDIDDNQSDEFEKRASMKFMSSSLLYYIQILISLINMLIIVLVNPPREDILYSIVPYLITLIPALMIGFFVRKYDNRYPKQGEAKYTEKTLNIMDEGERHITLESMYKIYHGNLTLIIIGGVVLGLFSISTDINQLFGLVILIILFAYNSFGYMLKIRQFYK